MLALPGIEWVVVVVLFVLFVMSMDAEFCLSNIRVMLLNLKRVLE